jgi:hypothetical protein
VTFYASVEDAMKAIDLATEDTIKDAPDLQEQEDSVYWEIAQSIMYDCSPEIRNELAKRTGVPIPGGLDGR